MIVDTSVLVGYFVANDPANPVCTSAIESAEDELIVSPFVVAELDYLLARRVGIRAALAALEELSGGAWELPHFGADDLDSAARVVRRYSDQNIGVADASNVVLAARYRTRTIATLDRRHFEVVRPLTGGRFTVLP